jgi:hypothetical protein
MQLYVPQFPWWMRLSHRNFSHFSIENESFIVVIFTAFSVSLTWVFSITLYRGDSISAHQHSLAMVNSGIVSPKSGQNKVPLSRLWLEIKKLRREKTNRLIMRFGLHHYAQLARMPNHIGWSTSYQSDWSNAEYKLERQFSYLHSANPEQYRWQVCTRHCILRLLSWAHSLPSISFIWRMETAKRWTASSTAPCRDPVDW